MPFVSHAPREPPPALAFVRPTPPCLPLAVPTPARRPIDPQRLRRRRLRPGHRDADSDCDSSHSSFTPASSVASQSQRRAARASAGAPDGDEAGRRRKRGRLGSSAGRSDACAGDVGASVGTDESSTSSSKTSSSSSLLSWAVVAVRRFMSDLFRRLGPLAPLFVVALHLLTATLFLAFAEGWALLDALYFSVVTATTVGYGDLAPTTAAAKLFVSAYAIVSVALIAGLLQSLVERVADAHRAVATRAQRAFLLAQQTDGEQDAAMRGGVRVGIDDSDTDDGAGGVPAPGDTSAKRRAAARQGGGAARRDSNDDGTALGLGGGGIGGIGGGIGRANSNDLVSATKRAVKHARMRLRATVLMVVLCGVCGVLLYGRFLNKSYVDMFYFLCVSMTTVGLGDIHPVTRIGKAYAAVWLVLTSLGFANVLSQYANLRVKMRERDVAQQIMSGEIGERMFREIDVDNDGTLSEAEFLGFMLCKLGKANPDEVRSVLRRFRQLDADGNGFISKYEVDATMKKKV